MFSGMIPLADGHLDLAINALSFDRDLTEEIAALNSGERHMQDHKARGRATVTLPAMKRAKTVFCMGTLLARFSQGPRPGAGYKRVDFDHATVAGAHAAARAQLAYYRSLEDSGHVRLIATKEGLSGHCRDFIDAGQEERLGIIIAFEGSDPIAEPSHTDKWWREGVRVASIVHYGSGRYESGTGTDGPVTPEGKDLLSRFEKVGVILDVTHLSNQSLAETLGIFAGPVLASHNNCRALVPGDRQFSDEQILQLVDRGSVIGVALDAWMLLPGWVRGRSNREEVSIETAADHIDHICQLAGDIRHAAIGTDLDGGYGSEQTPKEVNSIEDVHLLEGILQRRGYSTADIEAVFYRNWLDFFMEHLPGQKHGGSHGTTS